MKKGKLLSTKYQIITSYTFTHYTFPAFSFRVPFVSLFLFLSLFVSLLFMPLLANYINGILPTRSLSCWNLVRLHNCSSLPRTNIRSILHSSKPHFLTQTLYMFFRNIQLYSSLLPALRLPPESSLSYLITLNPWLTSQPTSPARSDRGSTIHLYNLFGSLLVHILHFLPSSNFVPKPPYLIFSFTLNEEYIGFLFNISINLKASSNTEQQSSKRSRFHASSMIQSYTSGQREIWTSQH